MGNTKTGYPIETLILGERYLEEVVAVHMPHSEFMEIVDVTLAGRVWGIDDDEGDVYPASVRDKVWPVAERMDRYPMGTWIDEKRGCGCVVGEYLVAADIIERSYTGGESSAQVKNVLAEVEDGDELFRFGNAIDGALSRRVVEEFGACGPWVEHVRAIAKLMYRNDLRRDVVLVLDR